MIKKFILKATLFCYLLASFLGSTHIHLKHHHTHDCKICPVVKTLSSGNTNQTTEKIEVFTHFFEPLIYRRLFISTPSLKGFFSTAPPPFFLC